MKRIVIIGAGCVGRGFIGKLFSDAGHYVYFIDKDMQLTEALKRGYYCVNSGCGAQLVGPVSKPEKWKDSVEIAKADLIIVSVGPENLGDVAQMIEGALNPIGELGRALKTLPDVWVVENMKDAANAFCSHYKRKTWVNVVYPNVYQGIANCIVPEVPRDLLMQDRSFSYGDANGQLVLPNSAWHKWLNDIVGFTDNFEPEWNMKWYMHCAFHLVVGLIGKKNGIEFVHQVFDDSALCKSLDDLLSEITCGVGKMCQQDSYNNQMIVERQEAEWSAMCRNGNYAGSIPDTCERLTRNLARKMQPGERMDDLRKLVSHPILDEAYEYALRLLEAK